MASSPFAAPVSSNQGCTAAQPILQDVNLHFTCIFSFHLYLCYVSCAYASARWLRTHMRIGTLGSSMLGSR